METVYVDGSQGEGGGQILRTSLALACITGKTLRMENIRAARRNPGLARQHVSCVHAARRICEGRCEGAAIGSQVLYFQPGPIRGGDYSFDIGSAGSASLVVQTVLPALFLAGGPSTVSVTGGTHNPWAPPFDFLAETFLPAIAEAGFEARCELHKHGFFPAGGGKISLHIHPWKDDANRTIDLCERGGQGQIHARIYTARLPGHIAERQKKLLLDSGLAIKHIEHIEVTDSDGPGNCVMLRVAAACRGGPMCPPVGLGNGSASRKGWPSSLSSPPKGHPGLPLRGWPDSTTVFTAFGQRGKPSEKVVAEVVGMAESFLGSGAAVDRFLADQLVLYTAIAKGGCYATNELSAHLTTNIETIKKFLPVEFTIEPQSRLHRISCAVARAN